MKYEHMGRLCPAFGWQKLAKLCFDPLWRTGLRPAQATGDASNMSVHNHSRYSKGIAKQHVCCFTADPRQGNQRRHLLRNLSSVSANKFGRATNQIFSFVAKESGGPNQFFEFGQTSPCQACRAWKTLKKLRGHQIHTCISTLRREDRCNQ